MRFLACVQMQHAYDEYNDRVRATGKSRGHFMVDLCSPGHMTACLRNFQEATRCTDETWESSFGEGLGTASTQLRLRLFAAACHAGVMPSGLLTSSERGDS